MRRRAARRARRPDRALPDRSLRPAAAAGRRARSRRRASRRSSTHLRSERRVVLRGDCTTPRAAGYPAETVDALWDSGVEGRDHQRHVPRAARVHAPADRRSRKAARSQAAPARRSFRSRRVAPPSAEGRWSLVSDRTGHVATGVADRMVDGDARSSCSRATACVTREVAAAEGITGGFSAVYDVLKALEDAGRIRRGYFVGGVGATQFALPAALDLLRSLREHAGRARGRRRCRRPIPRIPTARSCPGPATAERRRAAAARRAPSARSSSSSTARSPPTSAAAPASCSSSCPRTSRRARPSARALGGDARPPRPRRGRTARC